MQWNVFGSTASPISARAAAGNCRSARRRRSEAAAGVISGALAVRLRDRRACRRAACTTDVLINALEEQRRRPPPGRAEPGRAVGRYRELPGRRRISDPGRRHARHRHRRVTRNTASGSPSRRPCSSDGLINLKIEPEVSQIDPTTSIAVGNGITVPALIVRRAITTVELRDGQSFVIGGLLQSNNTEPDRAVALARQRAGAGRAVLQQVRTRRTKPTSSSS